jgi:hypothetical protein
MDTDLPSAAEPQPKRIGWPTVVAISWLTRQRRSVLVAALPVIFREKTERRWCAITLL